MSVETRSGPFITDSRSITPDQLQAIAGITGGVVATSDHDFYNIPYLKYGQERYERGTSIRFGEKDPSYSLPRPDYRYTKLTPLGQEDRFTTAISLYGHPTMHWHNPAIEVEEDRVTLVSRNWNSTGDRLVITRDTIQLVIQRLVDPIPQGPSPLV